MNIANVIHQIKRHISDNWYYFTCKAISCMGLVSVIITIISAVKPDILVGRHWIWYVCIGISVVYAVYKVLPRKQISISFFKRRVVEVKKGNIWDVKKGIVVIPVNNFFDTQVDDIVIGKRTLHGQFVEMYKKQYPSKDLDQEILKAIQADRLQPSGTYNNRKNVNGTHELAYPLGEVIRLKEGDLQYYLAVSTEFDEDSHIINQPEKYSLFLLKLITKIDRWNSGVPVYLPIIGSGQMGIPLTKQEIITEMLSCFNLAEHYASTGGTTILVYDNDIKEISLNKIKYQFSKI